MPTCHRNFYILFFKVYLFGRQSDRGQGQKPEGRGRGLGLRHLGHQALLSQARQQGAWPRQSRCTVTGNVALQLWLNLLLKMPAWNHFNPQTLRAESDSLMLTLRCLGWALTDVCLLTRGEMMVSIQCQSQACLRPLQF